MSTDSTKFEQRKRDHIALALDDRTQATGLSSLERVNLVHDSLPDLNLKDISIFRTDSVLSTRTPFFVAGMTAGHDQAETLNSTFASVASARGWVFGVGSQRREFEAAYEDPSLMDLKTRFPTLKIVSNLGMAQVIEAHASGKLAHLFKLAERMGASLLGVHLNPLQEAIQPEGTPQLRGALAALEALTKQSPIPVLIKETGCGMSEVTLTKLKSLHLFGVDVSGLGGTHWGRIEGFRAEENSVSSQLGETFKDWGVSTLNSLIHARKILASKTEVWSSGGVRSGLDAAKLLALGSTRVGFAMPALQAAMTGEKSLDLWMEKMESELKVAMFCTNSLDLTQLARAKVTYE